jgi:hypothetical protein
MEEDGDDEEEEENDTDDVGSADVGAGVERAPLPVHPHAKLEYQQRRVKEECTLPELCGWWLRQQVEPPGTAILVGTHAQLFSLPHSMSRAHSRAYTAHAHVLCGGWAGRMDVHTSTLLATELLSADDVLALAADMFKYVCPTNPPHTHIHRHTWTHRSDGYTAAVQD